jgi:hypothetical protein
MMRSWRAGQAWAGGLAGLGLNQGAKADFPARCERKPGVTPFDDAAIFVPGFGKVAGNLLPSFVRLPKKRPLWHGLAKNDLPSPSQPRPPFRLQCLRKTAAQSHVEMRAWPFPNRARSHALFFAEIAAAFFDGLELNRCRPGRAGHGDARQDQRP